MHNAWMITRTAMRIRMTTITVTRMAITLTVTDTRTNMPTCAPPIRAAGSRSLRG